MTILRTPATDLPGLIEQARQAQHAWAALSVQKRLVPLEAFRKLLVSESETLCAVLRQELDKTPAEVVGGALDLPALRAVADEYVAALPRARLRVLEDAGDFSSLEQPERFNAALKSVLSVSKSELQEILEAEKRANAGKLKPGPKPKTSASGRAVFDRG